MVSMHRFSTIVLLISGIWILSGCSEVTPPENTFLENSAVLESFATVDDDLTLLRDGEMPIEPARGVFSIGWNQFISPVDYAAVTSGHAFAVVIEEGDSIGRRPRPFSGGIDLGEVFLRYGDTQLELEKKEGRRGGIVYTLFKNRLAGSGLEFLAGETYEFAVSGSAQFSPLTIALTAPEALIRITSHANDQTLEAQGDLTISWEGGIDDAPVLLRIVPHRSHTPGTRPMPHRFPGAILEKLESNTGEYTLAAERLQTLLSDPNIPGVAVMISQIEVKSVVHDGDTLRAIMRNGDRVVLNLP